MADEVDRIERERKEREIPQNPVNLSDEALRLDIGLFSDEEDDKEEEETNVGFFLSMGLLYSNYNVISIKTGELCTKEAVETTN